MHEQAAACLLLAKGFIVIFMSYALRLTLVNIIEGVRGGKGSQSHYPHLTDAEAEGGWGAASSLVGQVVRGPFLVKTPAPPLI